MSTTIDGSASVTINSGAILGITSGTAVASTSGTSIDFTSIPSWVKRITVMFNGVSTSGTSFITLRLGSSGIVVTGYVGNVTQLVSGVAISSGAYTDGFYTWNSSWSASYSLYGLFVLTKISGNTWVASGNGGLSGGNAAMLSNGSISLAGSLDTVRVCTYNGTDTFDAGSINILYE